MIEPLIVVEGNLRLPTVRLLTDPSLNFGFEWSPARTRPVQSQSEFPLFAARFETAYVPAFRLSDTSSPYRAVSLWGVYARESIPRAVLNLMQGPRASGDVEDKRIDPVQLSVGAPMTAPVRKSLTSRPVAIAVAAAAGAMLIVWLLFGYEPKPSGETPPVLANGAEMPARPGASAHSAAPALAPVTTPRVPRAETVTINRPAASATATTLAATSKPLAISSEPSAVAPPQISSAGTRKSTAATAQAHPHPRKTVTKQAAHAEPSGNTAKRRKNSGAHSMADVTEQKHLHRAKAEPALRTTHAIARAHPADERIAAVESAWRARAASSHNNRSQPPKAPDAMNPEALYAILQHSPTLDSNAPASGARNPRAGGATGN
ncbi:hypothetical protein [Caballeronia ptereochthonis]|uniref:Uncharacterized protein n=1 Tax=Caballeronia ptereochthonis TaxID=1777144 RepID=A0A158DWT3_9BURK|nr:hypothetical protein [Caballeronia ptereochthonis]SAK99038.1 hypothetical protein AWB83_06003 [Caballeronia ptereochthonis]